MKFKRVLAGALVCATAAALFTTGCGKKEGNGDEEAYTIDWYHVCGTVPENVEPIEQAVDKYLEGKLNVKLKLHFLSWTPYAEHLNVMMAGGDKFDIAWVSGDTYRQNVAKNAFLPLDELIDKYAPKTKEMLSEDFLKGSKIKGVSYGIPANKDKGVGQGFLYRKDIADKYGLSESMSQVKTWEDLYPILDIIKEKEPDMVPLIEYGTASAIDFIQFEQMSFPAGIILDGDTTKVVNLVETDAYKKACERIRENRLRGYTRQDYDTVQYINEENHFVEIRPDLKMGISAMEISSTRKYPYSEVEISPAYIHGTDAVGSVMAISRTCKQPEKVMRFLEMFNTDPYLNNLIVYGIEGVNYEKIDDNTIRPIENSGYGNNGMQWEFGNVFINYLVEGEAENKHDILREFNERLKPSPALGFTADLEALSTETAACANVKAEFNRSLTCGDYDPETILPDYIKKLKAAGADKIVAECQKQYDEWRKNGSK